MMSNQSIRAKLIVLLVVATIMLALSPASATYRKPPFNGSIFGKRSGTIVNGGKFSFILQKLDN